MTAQQDRKLNVVYLAGGYPTPDNPSHGIFNKRAANAIKEHVNLTVIHYRIYKPKRKLAEMVKEDGFNRLILCVPYIPVMENRMYYVNNRLFYFFTLRYARQILENADIVHASDGNLGIFAAWLKKKFSFKLLVQFIGGDLNQDIVQFYRKSWMRSWPKQLDAVSFNSLALQEKYKSLFGAHLLSRVIYRGVDPSNFRPGNEKITGAAFYFLGGLPDYTTFTHGRNTKGGLNLMKAWTRLDSEISGNGIRLKFAGPDADIELVKDWRRTLREPGRVEINGKIEPSSIPSFHRSGNIALVPSLEEGLPNVAMEAAATGNLVIANAVGGIPEVITHGVNGLLCRSADEAGLYEQMKWAVNNADQVQRLGATAAEMIAKEFSSRDFGKKYTGYYHDMLNNEKP